MSNFIKKLLYVLAFAVVTFYAYGMFYDSWGELFAFISLGAFIMLKPAKWDE